MWMKTRSMLMVAMVGGLFLAERVMAHAGGDHFHGESSFGAGLTHPMVGLDHLLAMVAVGLLAVRMGTRQALWALPTAFVGMMVIGGLLALFAMPMPGAEFGISASVIVIGLAVAVMPRVPVSVVAGVIGLFAITHGYAHVAEMVGGSAAIYTVGFALGTAMLHGAGLGVGLAIRRFAGAPWLRATGGAIAACFAVMLIAGLL